MITNKVLTLSPFESTQIMYFLGDKYLIIDSMKTNKVLSPNSSAINQSNAFECLSLDAFQDDDILDLDHMEEDLILETQWTTLKQDFISSIE